jgi:hypothetical protein
MLYSGGERLSERLVTIPQRPYAEGGSANDEMPSFRAQSGEFCTNGTKNKIKKGLEVTKRGYLSSLKRILVYN